jgi:hypothetical protein
MDGQRCAVRMMRRKRLSASALPAIEDRGIRIHRESKGDETSHSFNRLIPAR